MGRGCSSSRSSSRRRPEKERAEAEDNNKEGGLKLELGVTTSTGLWIRHLIFSTPTTKCRRRCGTRTRRLSPASDRERKGRERGLIMCSWDPKGMAAVCWGQGQSWIGVLLLLLLLLLLGKNVKGRSEDGEPGVRLCAATRRCRMCLMMGCIYLIIGRWWWIWRCQMGRLFIYSSINMGWIGLSRNGWKGR